MHLSISVSNRVFALWIALVLLILPACQSMQPSEPAQPRVLLAAKAGVASPSMEASQIGAEVMRDGGNAVDAAVAVAFALAVTWPEAGNIGGGGFMMIAPTDGEPIMLDYRETAPAAATPDMFTLGESVHTAKAVGIPGTVRGLATAHARFGQLPWHQLVEPAIALAQQGIILDAALADSLNDLLADSPDKPELHRVYGKSGGLRWQAGDRLIQTDLARTLKRIADRGAEGFYAGPVARQIAGEMQRSGGIITENDLKNYQARWRQPVRIDYRSAEVYAPDLPSSGGITLAMMLNMLETLDLRQHPRHSAKAVHLLIEAQRRAFLERAKYLGDRDFVTIPAKLTTREYARELAQTIDPNRATPSLMLADSLPIAPEGDSTTHFSIVDEYGMAVSNTYTLEQSYGSRIVVSGGGFLLNNEMGDFNWKKGHTDQRGRIGTEANLIAPGKRMLSSMTPVIVKRDGRVILVTGSPGGRTIINTVLCVLVNVLEYDMSPVKAVQHPRLHHQWLPDVVRYEAGEGAADIEVYGRLRDMGHTLAEEPYVQGSANTISVDPQSRTLFIIGDRRRSRAGGVAGY